MTKIPQHLSMIGLGTYDIAKVRAFYGAWGWDEIEGSQPDWCAFDVGGTLLSFYSMDDLADEVSVAPRPPSMWGGYTLALNLASVEELTEVFQAAVDAGAESITRPQVRHWGGTSGYIADPDGNRWELATGGPNPAP